MKHIIVYLVASVFLFTVSAWAGSEVSSVTNHAERDKSCECIHNDCGCCEYLDWITVEIDGKVCTNFTYLPNDYGISITVTYNTYTIINETVSARNPPPMCFGIPEMEKMEARVCMRFYDLSFAQEHFHGCVKLSVSIYHVIHKSIKVGCFNIPKEAFAKNLATASHKSFASIEKELENMEHSKDNVPFVNMI